MKKAGNIFATITFLGILAVVVVVILALSGAFSGEAKPDPAENFKVGKDVAYRIVPIEVAAKGTIVMTKRDGNWRCDLWLDRELCFDGNGVLQYDGPIR
jgi:hypothetical protein